MPSSSCRMTSMATVALAVRCVAPLLLGAAALAAKVSAEPVVQAAPKSFQAAAESYAATIAGDGCLTNLQVYGVEFLAPGVSISRGSYFYANGPLKLSDVQRAGDRIVQAANEQAEVRYEFADDCMQWTVENRSDQQLAFFVVFSQHVSVGAVADRRFSLLPINDEATTARFAAGNSVLTVEGFDKLWGPWQGPHQVCQTNLPAGQQRVLKFTPSKLAAAERAQVAQLLAPAEEPQLALLSPQDYQVFQRRSRRQGEMLISGRTRTDAAAVEWRLIGDSKLGDVPADWQRLPVNTARQFNARVAAPAGGWYELQLRAVRGEQVLATTSVKHVGIGEVLLGAGQSNSTNSGQFKTKQTSGMASSFGGGHWQLADDPQPGVADRTQGGSFWPTLGDALYAKYGVPIGVAATGYGGTSVNQWQPDGGLFQDWLLTRARQLGPGGFRALLWHQGESDVAMSSDEYFDKLRRTITASRKEAGWEFPWIVAQASYHNPEKTHFENIRAAQARLWEEGVALQGPDTDELGGDHRDFDGQGIHFSPKGLAAHGELWAEKVSSFIDDALADETADGRDSHTDK